MKQEQRSAVRKIATGLALLAAVGIPLACNNGCASYHQKPIGKAEDYSLTNRIVSDSPIETAQTYQV